MRKKSHIILALQICQKLNNKNIIKHPYIFCFGNILPDCVPTFLTTPHRKEMTFEKVQHKIKRFIDKNKAKDGCSYRSTIQLGEIVHYIADYFTFPHNDNYTGSLVDHCHYENALKHELRRYIRSGEAMEQVRNIPMFCSYEELNQYVEEQHAAYIMKPSDVYSDSAYIVKVCMVVVISILLMVHLL